VARSERSAGEGKAAAADTTADAWVSSVAAVLYKAP
jgi:hypothetical protein